MRISQPLSTVCLLCMMATASNAAPTITVSSEGAEGPGIIVPYRPEVKKPEETTPLEPPRECHGSSEGKFRYNDAPYIKSMEFCDGTRWVTLLKGAPTANSNTQAACTPTEESLVRYNKHPDVKSYEFCNGATWIKMGSAALPLTTTIFNKPVMKDRMTPTMLTSGTFKEDGYVGAYLSCNGGHNHLSALMTVGEHTNQVAAATVQNMKPSVNEIDHSSFFSYVPKNKVWKIWVRQNSSRGIPNAANCTIKVTKFGT